MVGAPLTPWFRGTVFARPGFHAAVWLYVAIGNAFYFSALQAGDLLLTTLPTSVAIDSRLLVFVLTGYVTFLVNLYWAGTRTKASGYLQGASAFAATVAAAVDRSKPRAAETLAALHGAINAVGHYAFAWASRTTRFGISDSAMADTFNDRGYDGRYLLSLHKKQTVEVVRRAVMQTLHQERVAEDGCLRQIDAPCWEGLKRDLFTISGSAMSLISCVSSNKLPFAYFQL